MNITIYEKNTSGYIDRQNYKKFLTWYCNENNIDFCWMSEQHYTEGTDSIYFDDQDQDIDLDLGDLWDKFCQSKFNSEKIVLSQDEFDKLTPKDFDLFIDEHDDLITDIDDFDDDSSKVEYEVK
ncbi:MAG TPA: hypothetical protein VMX17_01950 [Candidatus Glassbacteria bacterium]|nr:hypothetical protein [Candidatus Glassbacteria bacterium]